MTDTLKPCENLNTTCEAYPVCPCGRAWKNQPADVQVVAPIPDVPDDIICPVCSADHDMLEVTGCNWWKCGECEAEWDEDQRTDEIPWRCFHCGQTFNTEGDAHNHFGDSERDKAACRVEPAPATVREGVRLNIKVDPNIDRFIRARQEYLEAAKKVSVGSYGAPPAAADARDAARVKRNSGKFAAALLNMILDEIETEGDWLFAELEPQLAQIKSRLDAAVHAQEQKS